MRSLSFIVVVACVALLAVSVSAIDRRRNRLAHLRNHHQSSVLSGSGTDATVDVNTESDSDLLELGAGHTRMGVRAIQIIVKVFKGREGGANLGSYVGMAESDSDADLLAAAKVIIGSNLAHATVGSVKMFKKQTIASKLFISCSVDCPTEEELRAIVQAELRKKQSEAAKAKAELAKKKPAEDAEEKKEKPLRSFSNAAHAVAIQLDLNHDIYLGASTGGLDLHAVSGAALARLFAALPTSAPDTLLTSLQTKANAITLKNLMKPMHGKFSVHFGFMYGLLTLANGKFVGFLTAADNTGKHTEQACMTALQEFVIEWEKTESAVARIDIVFGLDFEPCSMGTHCQNAIAQFSRFGAMGILRVADFTSHVLQANTNEELLALYAAGAAINIPVNANYWHYEWKDGRAKPKGNDKWEQF
jgi:hypothetical protein